MVKLQKTAYCVIACGEQKKYQKVGKDNKFEFVLYFLFDYVF